MQALNKILLAVMFLSSNFFDVQVFDNQCHSQRRYMAEQICISSNKAYIDILLPSNRTVRIPFDDVVKEVQVSFQGFFRSYVYENGQVNEKKESSCAGSI
jgi:hypothetical protein